MTFEKAMIEELETIAKLEGECWPCVAPKDSSGPFLVYRKKNIEYIFTHDGFNGKCIGEYEFAIVSKNYPELQELSEAVTAKIKSFLWRYLGTAGLLIEGVEIENKGDVYLSDSDFYRANLFMRIKY